MAEIAATREKVVILPLSASPFVIAFDDFGEALKLAPLWVRTGLIDVFFRFRRTRLGPFWHTLNLAAFVLAMGVIWSAILHQDIGQYFRYVTTSLMVWTLIASIVTDATGVLIAGQATAVSMRFPYPAFAFGHVWRGLLLFAHHLVFYIAVMAATLHSPGWTVLLAFPGLLLLVANGLWMTLLIGMICLRRRDLILVIANAMQIAMFVTPVFWQADLLGPELAFAAYFNPLYHLLQIVRNPLLGTAPTLDNWLWSLAMFAVGLPVTLWAYGRLRNRLAYWY